MTDRELKDRIEALSRVARMPVVAVDSSGAERARAGAPCAYCAIFRRFLPAGESCEKLHVMAGKRAMGLGESYLFSCHAGLCHIALPLLNIGAFEGAVLAGPFLLGELDSLLVSDVAKRYPIPTDAVLEMYEAAGSLATVSVEEGRALLKLVNYVFNAGPAEGGALEKSRLLSLQQRQIGQSIQMYKGFENSVPAYPYEKEKALIQHVRAGDAKKANELLNELLGYALFSTGGDLETIKSHTAELCSLLSRAAIEGGVEAADAVKTSHSYLRALWRSDSIEDICSFMQEMVERFCQSAFPGSVPGERAMLGSCIRFIRAHYDEPITLSDAAREAHLSESYFSTVFKRTSGMAFREYLTGVRVEEAKRLLSEGDLSVTEIALSTGFDSQSYFSKVFRKAVGLSPKEYRAQFLNGKT